MAGRFSFSSQGGVHNPWFRIGDVAFGSAAVFGLASSVVMVVGAFFPRLLTWLSLLPSWVLRGALWQVATWPFAAVVDLWMALSIAMVWYFGTMIETGIGRARMATLLGTITIIPGVLAVALDIERLAVGCGTISLVVILLFIADNPNRPFFFGIPGWILGVFFVALQVLGLIQQRLSRELLLLILTLFVGAFAGRAVGLLNDYAFIPRIPLPPGLSGNRRSVASRKAKGAPQRNHRGQVVKGPWASEAAPEDTVAAQAELDGLLDKISESGLDSLSKSEKQRLNELSKKLR